ncbi:MAG: helix-turn-helix transcriptional regulator [Ferrovibrio sp.]|uniref:helix-turn-helix transcriptional regulator n=1 Tax=Ferrovibrio sp. TaxID=1917215 RepID=UPI003919473E
MDKLNYYSADELAHLLGVSLCTLWRWHARRIGPARTKAGRQVFYRREAVETWLKRNETAEVR